MLKYSYNWMNTAFSLQWHHNERDGVSNNQPHDCLLNRLFKALIKNKTPKLRVTGLSEGNSPVTDEPAQMASNAKHVSIWWRHHDYQAGVDHLFFKQWYYQKKKSFDPK